MAKTLSSSSQGKKTAILLKVFMTHIGSYLTGKNVIWHQEHGLELHSWASTARTSSSFSGRTILSPTTLSGARGIVLCSSQRGLQTAEQSFNKELGTEEGWETGKQIGLRQANRTLRFEGH